jgi:UDP-N-acetylmuramoyl-L-alanyl-D-glutamate--2,6-diaminopimelate ligase
LSGRFNIDNALAALAAVLLSGASPSTSVEGLASVSPAPGRLERVSSGARGFDVFVDYAHTDDALSKVSRRCARALTRRRGSSTRAEVD